jgi:cytochrome c oxidase subunit 4
MNQSAHAASEPHDHGSIAHTAPKGVLVGVFLALMVLTAATVMVTWVDLGPLNLIIAMAIATVKAALVALFFMHLIYDHPFNGLVLIVALAFLSLFLSITLYDTVLYHGDIESYEQAQQAAGL